MAGMDVVIISLWFAALVVSAVGVHAWKVRGRLYGRHIAYAAVLAALLAQLAMFFVGA